MIYIDSDENFQNLNIFKDTTNKKINDERRKFLLALFLKHISNLG
jgi:hypothetical protein